MGRYGGAKSTIKKQRKKTAKRLGVPTRLVSASRAASTLGLRFDTRNFAKPGFEVKIRRPVARYVDRYSGQTVYERPSAGSAPDLEKALKMMKRYDPELERVVRKKQRPRR